VIARLEGVVVREYEKGGTAASIKAALDRAIDQLHRETKEKGDRVRDVVADAADKLRITIGTLPNEQKVEGAIEKERHEGEG
jgi:histidinol-phosphate/aromatic aminotransferase/cobyric acid decarboxylase-like protein